VALLSLACDPGIHNSPKDWASAEGGRFATTVGLFDITMRRIGGLIGETWLEPEITVTNHAKLPAVIDRAVLKANGLEHIARPFGDKKWVTISPGETKKIDITWEFDKPIYEILEDPVELDLTIKLGGDDTEVKIPMTKTLD